MRKLSKTFLDILAFLVLIFLVTLAIRYVIGDAQSHGHYTSWQRPDGKGSCCNDYDCAPAKARVLGHNEYEVWIPQLNRWEKVPQSVILDSKQYPSNDGSYHACYVLSGGDAGEGVVTWFCFNKGRTDL